MIKILKQNVVSLSVKEFKEECLTRLKVKEIPKVKYTIGDIVSFNNADIPERASFGMVQSVRWAPRENTFYYNLLMLLPTQIETYFWEIVEDKIERKHE